MLWVFSCLVKLPQKRKSQKFDQKKMPFIFLVYLRKQAQNENIVNKQMKFHLGILGVSMCDLSNDVTYVNVNMVELVILQIKKNQKVN